MSWKQSRSGAIAREKKKLSDGTAATAGWALMIRCSHQVPLRRAPKLNTIVSLSGLFRRPWARLRAIASRIPTRIDAAGYSPPPGICAGPPRAARPADYSAARAGAERDHPREERRRIAAAASPQPRVADARARALRGDRGGQRLLRRHRRGG